MGPLPPHPTAASDCRSDEEDGSVPRSQQRPVSAAMSDSGEGVSADQSARIVSRPVGPVQSIIKGGGGGGGPVQSIIKDGGREWDRESA